MPRVGGAVSLEDRQPKRCGISKENLLKTREASFQAFLDYDPGKNIMLDPKSCKHHPLICEDDEKDSIVTYSMTCILLHALENSPKDKTPTGASHSLRIRIRVTPDGKTTIIK